MDASNAAGKVLDRSQISTSFLILGYEFHVSSCTILRNESGQKPDIGDDSKGLPLIPFDQKIIIGRGNIAYLLILRRRGDNITHQQGKQFGHSMHASSKSAVRSTTTNRLTLFFCLVCPLSSY